MFKHTNKLTRDNYSCKYYDENNINTIKNLHHRSALKAIHINISSIAKHGIELNSYLDYLNINFDIIMLTETRETTTDVINMYFPNYDIVIKNPKSPR